MSNRRTSNSGPGSGQQLEQGHVEKAGAYKKILGAMLSLGAVLVLSVFVCFLWEMLTAVDCRDGEDVSFSLQTKTRRICMRKESRRGEVQFTVDTLIKNAVPKNTTELHRLPRGHKASGWFLTLMMCKHAPCGEERLATSTRRRLDSRSPFLLHPMANSCHSVLVNPLSRC